MTSDQISEATGPCGAGTFRPGLSPPGRWSLVIGHWSFEILLVLAAALLAVVSARPAAASYNDGSRLAAVECLVDHHTLSIDDSVYVRPPPRSAGGPHPYRPHPELV